MGHRKQILAEQAGSEPLASALAAKDVGREEHIAKIALNNSQKI